MIGVIVDTHTHVWHSPEDWGPAIGALLRRRYAAPHDALEATPAAHTEAMRSVDVAFVLGFRSGMLGSLLPASLIRCCLETHPDKLIGFAGVDPMEDDYLDAIDALDAQRMRGIVISPAQQGYHPAHTHAMRLYEKCEEKKVPVIVHQGENYVSASCMEYAQPLHLDAVAREFPGLRLLITHCGHPFTEQTLTFIGKHRHVYTEISGLTARPRQLLQTLLLAHQLGVTDKVLFGSDFPRQTPQQAIAAVYSLSQVAQGAFIPTVPREKLRGIVERDALDALGLERVLKIKHEDHEGAKNTKETKRELKNAI